MYLCAVSTMQWLINMEYELQALLSTLSTLVDCFHYKTPAVVVES